MYQTIIDIIGIIGGVGVVLIGLSKLIGGIWRDRLKERERKVSEQEIEFTRQHLSLQRIQADKFHSSQYDIYIQLWSDLQGLKFAVDALWERANTQNIAALANRLRHARNQIDNWSLFFENDHL